MGYRSEVAYAIVFKSTEDRDEILSRITPEQQQIVKEDADVREDRIYFHADSIKWYLSRDLEAYSLKGYDVVDAHDALIQAAQEAEATYSDIEKDENAVYSMGVFIRLGEEDDDTERETWGEYDPPEGFPDLWDLVSYSRSIDVGMAVIVLVRHRIGPSVYVGPFEDMAAVAAWADEHTPDTTWGIIEMQSPDNGPPNWA